VYVLRVEDSRRGLKVIVSRTHPNLLRKLFELEVPEIADGIVLIKSVAREPGQRSKVAVISTDERVDAVGACVGPRGSRVQSIVDELFDEKIDIVPWSEDPRTFITNALSPAKVNSMKLDEENRSAYVVVPDTQLSLAIGKGGQNVRLAARLTDWKIDIRSEAQAAAEKAEKKKEADQVVAVAQESGIAEPSESTEGA
jgi:N utilization substance protein A